MNKFESFVLRGAFAAAMLGATACGNDKPVDHQAEITKLQAEHTEAQANLAGTLEALDSYLVSLPDPCRSAAELYRDGNVHDEISTRQARQQTADKCSPEHENAVEEIRYLDSQAYEFALTVNDTEWWIAANVAASLGLEAGEQYTPAAP